MIYEFAQGSFIEAGQKLATLPEYDELQALYGLDTTTITQKSQYGLTKPPAFLKEIVSLFLETLAHQSYDELVLSCDHAILLSMYLTDENKQLLWLRSRSALEKLDKSDPLHRALESFLALVLSETPMALKKEQKALLAYHDLKQTFPALSQHLVELLTERLNNDAPIEKLSILGPYAGSYQRRLLSYQSEGTLSGLRSALAKRIYQCYQSDDAQKRETRIIWHLHAKMAIELQNLPGESLFSLTKQMRNLEKQARAMVKRYLGEGGDSGFYLIHYYLPPMELQHFYRSVLFLNLFGQGEGKRYIKRVVHRLIARQRKAMMTFNTDPLTLNFIQVMEEVVELGGAPSLVEAHLELIESWEKALENPQPEMTLMVQQRILECSLDHYQQYFVTKMQRYLQKYYPFCDEACFESLYHAAPANAVMPLEYDQVWLAVRRCLPDSIQQDVEPEEMRQLCLGVAICHKVAALCQEWRTRVLRDPVQVLYFAPEELANAAMRYTEALYRLWKVHFYRLSYNQARWLNTLSDYVMQWPQKIRCQ